MCVVTAYSRSISDKGQLLQILKAVVDHQQFAITPSINVFRQPVLKFMFYTPAQNNLEEILIPDIILERNIMRKFSKVRDLFFMYFLYPWFLLINPLRIIDDRWTRCPKWTESSSKLVILLITNLQEVAYLFFPLKCVWIVAFYNQSSRSTYFLLQNALRFCV